MRWGAASASTESLRWVRPLQGNVALLGEDVVPFEIAGVASGAVTLGHRFHHPAAITIRSATEYVDKLREAHGIVEHDERAASNPRSGKRRGGKGCVRTCRSRGSA